MTTKVKATKDGPYLVSGGAVVEDGSGKTQKFEEDKEFWLCRCGASKNKPFCDGTHAKIGFKADK